MAESRFGMALQRRVAEKLGYHVVWAIGPAHPVYLQAGANRGLQPVKFGASFVDAKEAVRQIRKWGPIRAAVRSEVWVKTRDQAETLIAKIEANLEVETDLNPRWYDLTDTEIRVRMGIAASEAGVEMFDIATYERIRDAAIEVEVARLKSRMRR